MIALVVESQSPKYSAVPAVAVAAAMVPVTPMVSPQVALVLVPDV